MTRRELRHALALPVLVAAAMCVVLPSSALAQSGKGHSSSQQDKSGYERSEKKRGADNNQRGNGKSQGGNGKNQGEQRSREHSRQKQQGTDDQYDYRGSRGEKSGRGRSDEQRQDSDDHYNNGRNAQQSQSLSPQQAAQRARSQYGGQVLKVQPGGGGYQVRLIQEDGRVVTVPIAD
jgi:hypothetical protein